MENKFSKRLEKRIKPLYSNLIEKTRKFQYPKSFFCMQWGRFYPKMENTGILFIGRATNGWITDVDDIERLFGSSTDRIFNRGDQMQWVEDCEGNTQGYNSRRSAFWRVTKNISKEFYPNNWSAHVAWSNICKVTPFEKGNPSDALYYEQIEICNKILKIEIELLSPKIIILFTAENWAKDFLCYLNNDKAPISIKDKYWGQNNQYQLKVYLINGRTYILTEHPQGKKEDLHTKAIIETINESK